MEDIQWSFISVISSSLIHLLLRMLLGKELGPSGLGLYTLAFTIYMFGMQFGSFGIEASLTKYIASCKGDFAKIGTYISSGITGSILSGLVMGCCLFLLSPSIGVNVFHSDEMVTFLRLNAISLPFLAIQRAVLGSMNGLRQMNHYAFFHVVQNASMLFLSIIMVMILKMSVLGAVLGFVIPTIILGSLMPFSLKKYLKYPYYSFNSALSELSLFGFFVVLANSVSMVNTQVDSVLIGYFMNEVSVGYYAVAVILLQGILLIPNSIQKVTTPLIAGYSAGNDYQHIKSLIKKTMAKTFVVTAFLAGLIIIIGKFLIINLFSEDFLPAYLPLLILLIGYSIDAPFIAIDGWFSSVGRVKLAFQFVAVLATLNIILNIILIPKFGLVGAAIATSLSFVIIAFLDTIFLKMYIFK